MRCVFECSLSNKRLYKETRQGFKRCSGVCLTNDDIRMLTFKFQQETKIRRQVSFVTATPFKTFNKGEEIVVLYSRCSRIRWPSCRGTKFSSTNGIYQDNCRPRASIFNSYSLKRRDISKIGLPGNSEHIKVVPRNVNSYSVRCAGYT